jgi:hypothetical protein
MDALQKWLEENPIKEADDVAFLKRTVSKHRQALLSAQSATEQESQGLNRTGSLPYLRLIHCIVDDSIKNDYKNRDRVEAGRMAIENRNSVVREENVWEKIANLWNNPNFEPETLIFPDLHPYEFQTSQKLSFDQVQLMSKAVASKVKDKIALMTRTLRRCIDNSPAFFFLFLEEQKSCYTSHNHNLLYTTKPLHCSNRWMQWNYCYTLRMVEC